MVFFSARICVSLPNAAVALMRRDVLELVCSCRRVATTVLGWLSTSRDRPLSTEEFTWDREKIVFAKPLSLHTRTSVVLAHMRIQVTLSAP